jgi:hypothetical protein
MDLDHLQKLVILAHDEGEATNADDGPQFAALVAYLDEIRPQSTRCALGSTACAAERDALKAELVKRDKRLQLARDLRDEAVAQLSVEFARRTQAERDIAERIEVHLKTLDPNTPVGIAVLDITRGAWRKERSDG